MGFPRGPGKPGRAAPDPGARIGPAGTTLSSNTGQAGLLRVAASSPGTPLADKPSVLEADDPAEDALDTADP